MAATVVEFDTIADKVIKHEIGEDGYCELKIDNGRRGAKGYYAAAEYITYNDPKTGLRHNYALSGYHGTGGYLLYATLLPKKS